MEATTHPLLEAQHLAKTYVLGKIAIPVLKDVSLNVTSGEIISIMGSSGSGKSTLLHLLGGLDQPTAGRVFFKQQDLYDMPSARRSMLRAQQVGFVFQSYHLLPELNVLENVVLPSMSSMGYVRRAASHRERARALLKQVGLDHREDHRPSELSGGEQQRAAIARALMNDPELMLADEPTGNLDARTGETVLDCLFHLVRDLRRTLVMVTHNIDIARRCDRRLLLHEGTLVPSS